MVKCWLVLFWKSEDFEKVKELLGEDYLMYFDYVQFCLENFDFPALKWAKSYGDEGWVFSVLAGSLDEYIDGVEDYLFGVLYETKRVPGGMRAFTRDDVVEAYRSGRVINYFPDKQKIREYKIYKCWKNDIEKLIKAVEKALRNWWREEDE